MADIELVIKIPEELVSELDDDDYERVMSWYETTLYCAIKEGAPLPKNHGRLIDVSDIEWAKHREERNYIDYEVIDWDDIVNAPTIIEAEREEEK